jgi:phage baseplate assembly protein W
MPLRSGPGGQYLMVQEYSSLVKQNFKNLLLTTPGERMMDINFGVGLRGYLFEPNDSFVQSEISGRIEEQVRKYLPYLEVLDIDFSSSDTDYDASKISVKILYEVIPLGVQDLIAIDAVKTAMPF